MTVQQREWQDVFEKALRAKIDELHATKQIPGKADILSPASEQYAEELYEKGDDPENAASFVAMSLVRRQLLDEIRQLTIEKRNSTDESRIDELERRIESIQNRYNELMGTDCFECSKKPAKPINEGTELPNMICWGRGYGETSNPSDTSVISKFNSLVARNDPYTGGINPVLSQLQQFDASNASKYTVDPDPELDKYVDTVFLGDMGPESFTLNGENPYRVLDKIKSGETVDIPSPRGVAVRPRLPEVTKESPDANPDYVQAFNEIFSVGD